MAHTTEPTAKRLHEAVIAAKKEALQGRRSPAGAAAWRDMLALQVYNLIRAETESDEIAVQCRSAILSTLKRIANDDMDEPEADDWEERFWEGNDWQGESDDGDKRTGKYRKAWRARRPGETSET